MGRKNKLVLYNGVWYHPYFFVRRLQCIEMFQGICQHCGRKQGDEYTTDKGRKDKVIIQAAHLDHDPWRRDARLIALCKQCHMRYDGPMHGKKGLQTKNRKKVEAQYAAGQLAFNWMIEHSKSGRKPV